MGGADNMILKMVCSIADNEKLILRYCDGNCLSKDETCAFFFIQGEPVDV